MKEKAVARFFLVHYSGQKKARQPDYAAVPGRGVAPGSGGGDAPRPDSGLQREREAARIATPGSNAMADGR
jgi:hypothetical protein